MGRFKIPVGVVIFLGIWLLALCVPTTREIPRSWLLIRQSDAVDASPIQQISAKLARQQPDDPTAAGWAADAAFSDVNSSKVRQVFARFPDDLSTRALWLRACAGLFPSIDAARKNPNQQRVALWKEAAQIARGGAQSEPNNAFWPWIEASFAFGIGDERAAYAAMRRAGSCADHNDYLAQTTRARVALMKSHLDASFERKLLVFYSVFYAHWAVMGDAADLTSERARALKRAGATDEALVLEDAVLNVARVRRAHSDTLLNALVSEHLARKSLEKFLGIPKPREPGQTANGSYLWIDPAIHGQVLAEGWAAFARQSGRPELANSASFVGEPGANREFNNFDELTDWAQFGMRAPWGGVAALGPSLLLVLALTIGAGAATWLATGPLRPRGVAPTRGQVVASANFSFWLFLGLFAVAFAKSSFWFNPIVLYAQSQDSGLIAALGYITLTLICWLLPVWFVGWKRGRNWKRTRPTRARPLSPIWNRARKTAWIIGAVGAGLGYSNGRGLWDDTPFQWPVALAMVGVGVLCALSLEIVRWNRAGTRLFYARDNASAAAQDAPGKRVRFAALILWALFFIALMFLVRGLFLGSVLFDRIVLSIPTLALLGGAFYASWKSVRDHFRWQLARRTLGALLLMWSVALLFFAMALVPLRAQLNRNFDRRIELGELAWMRGQAAQIK